MWSLIVVFIPFSVFVIGYGAPKRTMKCTSLCFKHVLYVSHFTVACLLVILILINYLYILFVFIYLFFFYNKQMYNSWFQTFAVFWILYVFFWVFPRRLIVVCRRFGTLYQFHLHRHTSYPAYEDGTDRAFRNVGIQQSDAGEIPKRIYRRFL